MPMNNSQLSSMWGGMPSRSMQMGGRGMMEVGFVLILKNKRGMVLTLQSKCARISFWDVNFFLVKMGNNFCF